jgi:hypothetical protein
MIVNEFRPIVFVGKGLNKAGHKIKKILRGNKANVTN